MAYLHNLSSGSAIFLYLIHITFHLWLIIFLHLQTAEQLTYAGVSRAETEKENDKR